MLVQNEIGECGATKKYNDLLSLFSTSRQGGKKAYSSSLFSCFNKANQLLSLN